MVAGGRGYDVAMAGDLPCESGDGACDLVDFGEEDDAWEAGLGVVRDRGVVEEDTWREGFLVLGREFRGGVGEGGGDGTDACFLSRWRRLGGIRLGAC